MRRFLVILTVLGLLLMPTMALADEPIRLVVNNVEVQTDVSPVIENDRTLVPVRALSEELGFTVAWDDATETVTLTAGESVIKLTVGQREALVGDRTVLLDVPAVNRGGRVLIPLRFVLEELGAVVEWDEANRIVAVTVPEPAPTPVVDPAALELLSKLEELDNVRIAGEVGVSVGTEGLALTVDAEMETYAQGEDSLTYQTVSMFGMTERTGNALYKGQMWQLDAAGVWSKVEALPELDPALEEPLTPPIELPVEPAVPSSDPNPGAAALNPLANPLESALEDPAALTEMAAEMLNGAEITLSEQSYEGVTYDVVMVSFDAEALGLSGVDAADAAAEGEFTMAFWLAKGTAALHHLDMGMHMTTLESGVESAFDMAGIFFVEPWETPIPFPAEILEAAVPQQ